MSYETKAVLSDLYLGMRQAEMMSWIGPRRSCTSNQDWASAPLLQTSWASPLCNLS